MIISGHHLWLFVLSMALGQFPAGEGNSLLRLRPIIQRPSAVGHSGLETRPGLRPQAAEAERHRAIARQQFTKNFRDLQLASQRLLRDHEAGRLSTTGLAKEAKSINKSAKNLRNLMALGELASPPAEVERELDTPQEFDQSVRRLAKLVYDFAHNPVHQNSKVFNTAAAARAQTDLLSIINLSKVLESQARNYTPLPPLPVPS